MTSKPTTAQHVLKITSFILRLLLNVIFYAVVIILITRVSKQTYDFCYQIFGQVTASEEPGRDIEIQIKKGESTMNVASKLKLNKIIVDKYSFYVKAKLKKHKIMPGTFVVNTSMTYDEIFAIIIVPSEDETDQTGADEVDVSGDKDTTDDADTTDDTDTTDETTSDKSNETNVTD